MSNDKNDVIFKQLTAQIEEYNSNLKKEISKSKKRRNIINVIAEKCCDAKYGFNQLGGDNEILHMSDVEMRDFIITNILNQKQEYIKMITELQNGYLEENRLKEEFSRKYLILKEENKVLKNKVSNLEQRISLMPSSSKTTDTKPDNNINLNSQANNISSNTVSQKIIETDIVYVNNEPYDIDKTYQKVNTYQFVLLKLIGDTGLSEFQEILARIVEKNNFKEKMIRTNIDELINMHILNEQNIGTPLRSKIKLLELTELGKAIYFKETGKKPEISEIQTMLNNHASLRHGYCIKETAKSLQRQGYANVCYDASKNTIQLADNRRYVPDIIADHSKSVKTYWEVELAHHTDKDFFEKLDKAMKVTPNLYIIAPDKEAKTKLRKQIDKYTKYLFVNSINAKITIFLGTLNELEKRQIFSNEEECKITINIT